MNWAVGGRELKSRISETFQLPAHVLRFDVDSLLLPSAAEGGALNALVSSWDFVSRLETICDQNDVMAKDPVIRLTEPKCDCCGDGASDRFISWARSEDDEMEDLTCLHCGWNSYLCDRCLVASLANKLVCVECVRDPRETRVALEDVHVRYHEWMINVSYFRDRWEEYEKAEKTKHALELALAQ